MKHKLLLPIPDAWLGTVVCIVLPLMLTLMLLLSACGSLGGSLFKPTPFPQISGPLEQPLIVPYQPFTLAQACLDITGSYPYADFKKAEWKIADAIDQAVQPNSNGLTVFANLITSNSWTDDSTFFIARLSPIPADPTPPALSKHPVPTGNVFLDQQKQKRVEQANSATLSSYQALLKQRHTALAQMQQVTHHHTNTLRAYTVAQTNQGTDIYGCLGRAASRMQGVRGKKLLLVASDLQNNLLTQDVGNLNLSGVRVVVIYHYCAVASTCQTVNTWFANLVLGAKASSVAFYDVAQSDTLADVFSA